MKVICNAIHNACPKKCLHRKPHTKIDSCKYSTCVHGEALCKSVKKK